jgi:hypothetical protein
MELCPALLTALISAVTAFPTDPLSDISPADRSIDLLKRDCASGWFCTEAGAKKCLCNQGKKVRRCTFFA